MENFQTVQETDKIQTHFDNSEELNRKKQNKTFFALYLIILILTSIGFFSSFAPLQIIFEIITFITSIFSLTLLIIMSILLKVTSYNAGTYIKKFILILILCFLLVIILIVFSGLYAFLVLNQVENNSIHDWHKNPYSYLSVIPGFANVCFFTLSVQNLNISKKFTTIITPKK